MSDYEIGENNALFLAVLALVQTHPQPTQYGEVFEKIIGATRAGLPATISSDFEDGWQGVAGTIRVVLSGELPPESGRKSFRPVIVPK